MEARSTTRRDRAGRTIVHAGLQEAIRRHTAMLSPLNWLCTDLERALVSQGDYFCRLHQKNSTMVVS